MAPRKQPQSSTAKPKSAPRMTRNSNTAGSTEPPVQDVVEPHNAVQPESDTNPFAPQGGDSDNTPKASRIMTRANNTTKHPGDALNTYKKKRRTQQEIEADRQRNAEQKEKKEAERLALLNRIAELEQQIDDNEPFGATPQATIPKARRLRRTETYIEIPSSDAEEKRNAMEVDETDHEEFKLDSEEEATEKEDDQPKNARLGNPVLGKRKAAAKGNHSGDEAEGQKDNHGEEQGKKKKKSKTKVRDEIDEVRGQIAKARNGGAEVTREEPVIGLKDPARSVIDQQREGGKSADRNPKGFSEGKNASTLIQDWVNYVDTTTNTKLPTNNARSSASTRTSSQATKVSPLSDQVAITSRESTGLSNADLNIDSVTGGLADEVEVWGAERDEAVNSPPKGRVRATSANIVQVDVKVEDSPVPMKIQKAKSSAFSNKQLPKGCLEDDAWRGIVIPTFIWWASHQDDPWNIEEEDALAALQSIWDPTYKKMPRKITLDDPVFKNAWQRLCDSWKNPLGSSPLAMVNSFFDADEKYSTNEARQLFAEEVLEDLSFLYAETDSGTFRGLFQSPFILRTFAAHYVAIRGARKIKAFGDMLAPEKRPKGSLALSITGLERAFTLWADRLITIERVAHSRSTGHAVALKTVINPETGKASPRETGFNEYKWGDQTRYYLASIAKLSDETWDTIINEARKLAKVSRRGARSELEASASTETQPVDRRALLVDLPVLKRGSSIVNDDCKPLHFFKVRELTNWSRTTNDNRFAYGIRTAVLILSVVPRNMRSIPMPMDSA